MSFSQAHPSNRHFLIRASLPWMLFLVGLILTGCRLTPAQSSTYNSGIAEPVVTPLATPSVFVPVDTPDITPIPPTISAAAIPPFEPVTLSAPDCNYGGQFKSIAALDAFTIHFDLCQPDPAFLAKIAHPAFSIYPSEWLESSARDRKLRLEEPVGSGPFRIQEWRSGEALRFTAFENYWGTAGNIAELIFHWEFDPEERLLSLQAGASDGIDDVIEMDYPVIQADPELKLVFRPPLSVSYLGFNNTTPPFDNPLTRQAIAMGLDRQRLLQNAFPLGYQLAEYFVPCSIPYGCAGQPWYDFDSEGARQTLTQAGYPDGFSATLSYQSVRRGYLPHPELVAKDIQLQLKEILNITVKLNESNPDTFVNEVEAGQVGDLFLLGWGADYPHISNFMTYNFLPEMTRQFGNPYADIIQALNEALIAQSPIEQQVGYESVNNLIRLQAPLIPLAHGSWISPDDAALAYRSDIDNAHSSPLGLERFADLSHNSGAFTWMQRSEPLSLYCADETDIDTLRACSQIAEPLYRYTSGQATVQPNLAEICQPEDNFTRWKCTLRKGVLFQDGTSLDARDVFLSLALQWDAKHTLRGGRLNSYEYFRYYWGNNINNTP